MNHGSSKASNDPDEIQNFCKAWAKKYDIPLKCINLVIDADNAKSYGVESAERDSRYLILAKNLADDEILLTGHHLNDSIETVLFRLARGTSIKGLVGISREVYLYGIQIIRPLINKSKKEILHEANHRLVLYRHDSSNDGTDLSRAFIRNKIVPRFVEHFTESKFIASMKTFIQNTQEATELLDDLFELDYSSCKIDDNRIDLDKFKLLSEARQRHFIHMFLSKRLGYFPTKKMVNEIKKRLDSQKLGESELNEVLTLCKDKYSFSLTCKRA